MFTKLKIRGFRGFASWQTLKFARPSGKVGSGLTVVVGANNSGKSTIIESLRALAQSNPPGFTQGRRNRTAGDRVELCIKDNIGNSRTLKSIQPGGSETDFQIKGNEISIQNIFVLPSRRAFNPYFGKNELKREQFTRNIGFPAVRTSSIDQFSHRLFVAQKNKSAFNEVLERVITPVPEWKIDQLDSGQHFLKISSGNSDHSSEGLGEGLVSLFYIVDALYDSTEEQLIVIDEPELSLHPHLQRKLSKLLTEFSAKLQILVATHSPYFVNLEALSNGAVVTRVFQEKGRSKIAQLGYTAANGIASLLRNYNNPHILGLKAQEVFFLEDKIVLVEGQEDVVFYSKVLDQLDMNVDGLFFGWGVGGASNMDKIAAVLKDLKFKKVVGILDANERRRISSLSTSYPGYLFLSIPADDIRTKKARHIKRVIGLLDKHMLLRKRYSASTRQVISDINEYFECE